MQTQLGLYFDYAATTPLAPEVAEAMLPWQTGIAGNGSAVQTPYGFRAQKAIEQSKQMIADAIGANTDEIFFTSGATEANNWALFGLADHLQKTGKTHLVSSPTEHAAILQPLKQLSQRGFDVSYSKLLPCGMADGCLVQAQLTDKTGLISLQLVNNETGVINPLEEVRDFIQGSDILLHCDATQALGKLPINVKQLGLHLASFSAHKAYGPQGIGALYIRKDIQPLIKPLLYGGAQQTGLRSGTFPVGLIVGFAKACHLVQQQISDDLAKAEQLHQLLRDRLDQANITYKINGHDYGSDSKNWRVPHILNIALPDIQNDWLLEILDGVSFSTGSACSQQGDKASHVLTAMHAPAENSIRLSFGRYSDAAQINLLADKLINALLMIEEMIDQEVA